MSSQADPNVNKSKIELQLNVGAIADMRVREQAAAAVRDIERTMLTLQDGRLDQAGVERALGWESSSPLLLPPNWREKSERDVANGSTQQRFPMPLRRAEHWSVGEDGTLSLVVVYSVGDVQPEVFERQTYRRAGGRWKLVKQERLAAPM